MSLYGEITKRETPTSATTQIKLGAEDWGLGGRGCWGAGVLSSV